MTEADWNSCTDPTPMLEFLRGKASERKLRLFAVACCRCNWHILTDGAARRAVEVAELHADKLASDNELTTAEENASEVIINADHGLVDTIDLKNYWGKGRHAFIAVVDATNRAAHDFVWRIQRVADLSATVCGRHTLAGLLRDIIGSPFQPMAIDPSYLNQKVKQLALAIYNERAFDRMPILADALEDAGCTQQEIVNHCRQPGVHVRGCWAVDLLLEKK